MCDHLETIAEIWFMPKHPRYLVLSKTTWHGQNMLMDVFDKITFQGPFRMDQISYGYFVKDKILQKHRLNIVSFFVLHLSWNYTLFLKYSVAYCSLISPPLFWDKSITFILKSFLYVMWSIDWSTFIFKISLRLFSFYCCINRELKGKIVKT